ncbi:MULTISPECIES: hypothetical protein [unclassified Streptomyces]|uniref:hypothetical protein n=1 Tax=unclassified Streptomyces TaxID=2593676 RepID=UPI000C27BB91|nr:hypothetical protein [Streptomyces sp. CB02959]PJN39179.1 hypothetical protein CG747_19515 [Streptomyces sp. CB02959]
MWSGRHDDYVEQTVRAVVEEVARRRAVQRAKAVKYSRELVAESRRIAQEDEAAELERRAVLGQMPQAEYKSRAAALAEGVAAGRNPFAR